MQSECSCAKDICKLDLKTVAAAERPSPQTQLDPPCRTLPTYSAGPSLLTCPNTPGPSGLPTYSAVQRERRVLRLQRERRVQRLQRERRVLRCSGIAARPRQFVRWLGVRR